MITRRLPRTLGGRSDTNPLTTAEFTKMSGAGNDFVVIDDRDGRFPEDPADFVRRICCRRLSVGADGLLLLSGSRRASVAVRYYNADGSRARFCANGTRCAARFAFVNVIAGSRMSIETDWAVISAEVADDRVTLSLPPVEEKPAILDLDLAGRRLRAYRLDVGVPHLALFLEEGIEDFDVDGLGRQLRAHPDLGPEGANVNFVEIRDEHQAVIRSFERGVEAETLSCGSGVVAAALVGFAAGWMRPPVVLETRAGSELEVAASVLGQGFADIRLAGDARIVFRSRLTTETTGGFRLMESPRGKEPCL